MQTSKYFRRICFQTLLKRVCRWNWNFKFGQNIPGFMIVYQSLKHLDIKPLSGCVPTQTACVCYYYYYYYYYYLLFWEFFLPALVDSFLLEFEWQQVSSSPWIFLGILADLNNVVNWMDSARSVISKSASPCINLLVTVPSASFTIGINVTFMFHSFFNSPAGTC